MSESNPDVKFVQVDVDEQEEIAAEHGVRAMPTFMLFKNGEKANEVIGANVNALTNMVSKA